MTERTQPGIDAFNSGVHLQVSKLFVATTVVAVGATGALIAGMVTVLGQERPPPGPGGMPPPPPLDGLGVLTVLTGLFVLSWLSTLVVFARDQVLQRMRVLAADPEFGRPSASELVAELRARLSEDRQFELDRLEERIISLTAEYGEQRETDGYLNGMRTATAPDREGGEVRPIRRALPRQ